MPKIVVGPVGKGFKADRLPFYIDNDSFPTIINAYQWRGRIKRKRGNSLLARLQRFLGTTDGSGNLTVTITSTPITTGISTFTVGSDIFVDPGGASPVTLLTNSLGSATLNRSTGVLTITGSQLNTTVLFFPTLPVMGLEDFNVTATQFPGTIAFDTRYVYNISTSFPYTPNDVGFYKNPQTGRYSGYTQKSTWTRTSWNGQDYQQFWTVNYEGAFWATNGINIPFSPSSVGMQFAPAGGGTGQVSAATWVNATTMTFTIAGNPLVVGDFVFVNEFTGGSASFLNFQTGFVTVSGNTFTVVFPNATLPSDTYTPGIIQYLTNRSDPTIDCIRWFDGDPTNGQTPPTFVAGNGWVNFMPPLSNLSFSIDEKPPAQYYLAGARMIFPFKDRLLFFGPVIQSSGGNKFYLQDTIIYSQNGTPYYTASFAGNNPGLITTVFNPILVPGTSTDTQTATPPAWWEDQTGFGGFISAGVDQPIISLGKNEDVLIVEFSGLQTRLIYSGDDLIPFNFFLVNSELGTSSTFSSITMDQGVLARGDRGFILVNQIGARRFDTEIPDQVFQISLANNGNERVTSQRDFINEWIYFTYPSNEFLSNKFPNQTLLYNYRDDSFGLFNESFTTYGAFRRQSGLTWATLPADLTWDSWDTPWNSGVQTLFQPLVIAGNQQGFVFFKETLETEEPTSLTIQNTSGNTITSPKHGLNNGDYIIISGALGAVGTQVNGKIFSVLVNSSAIDTFQLLPPIASTGSDYQGGGLITRMYVPNIQTKQFPVAWELGRKTRIGVQQYLLTTTVTAQIQLLIFLSQNAATAYNNSPIVPSTGSVNNSLIYSTTLATCPESTNLGLTQANTNLQQLVEVSTGTSPSSQMWHRISTSLIGDTVQLGFTLSDAQMRDTGLINQFAEIELHGFIIDVTPSQVLA